MLPLPCRLNKDITIQQLSINGHILLCIDDFLEDPHAFVDFACQSSYNPYPGMLERKGYPGIRSPAPDTYSYNLTTFLEPLIKQVFNIPADKDIRKSMCAMSLLTIPSELLGPLQRTPHFDSSTPHHIAALLYLCSTHHGGTAFYRHNATGIEQLTPNTVEPYLETYYDEINREKPSKEFFSVDNKFFTQTGYIEAKFNRLVLYKGSLLHSAYINPSKSIDSNPKTGRLTVNTFFDF